jgi:hypothetical protein
MRSCLSSPETTVIEGTSQVIVLSDVALNHYPSGLESDKRLKPVLTTCRWLIPHSMTIVTDLRAGPQSGPAGIDSLEQTRSVCQLGNPKFGEIMRPTLKQLP